jgi:hypothetical protein
VLPPALTLVPILVLSSANNALADSAGFADPYLALLSLSSAKNTLADSAGCPDPSLALSLVLSSANNALADSSGCTHPSQATSVSTHVSYLDIHTLLLFTLQSLHQYAVSLPMRVLRLARRLFGGGDFGIFVGTQPIP